MWRDSRRGVQMWARSDFIGLEGVFAGHRLGVVRAQGDDIDHRKRQLGLRCVFRSCRESLIMVGTVNYAEVVQGTSCKADCLEKIGDAVLAIFKR